jgi:hypothetical protein
MIVMPETIDKHGLALSSLDDNPTFLISANGPQIVVDHAHEDSMQVDRLTGNPRPRRNPAVTALSRR